MKVNKFEDLDCWKKARELANLIYNLTDQPNYKKIFDCVVKCEMQVGR